MSFMGDTRNMSELSLDDLPQPKKITTVSPGGLEVDGDNPNEQSDEMFGLLCDNMRDKGWIGNHIVATTDGLIADGTAGVRRKRLD